MALHDERTVRDDGQQNAARPARSTASGRPWSGCPRARTPCAGCSPRGARLRGGPRCRSHGVSRGPAAGPATAEVGPEGRISPCASARRARSRCSRRAPGRVAAAAGRRALLPRTLAADRWEGTFGSRRTLDGCTSSRRPIYVGCRSLPSAVHSVNFTSATSCGRIQCGRSFGRGRTRNGDSGVSSGFSSAATLRKVFPSKPVPVWPTYSSAPVRRIHRAAARRRRIGRRAARSSPR